VISEDGVHQQQMYYYGLSTFMINKDGFSTQHMIFSELFSLSIPAESKRAKKMLEPADECS